jgi:hypothetical protein
MMCTPKMISSLLQWLQDSTGLGCVKIKSVIWPGIQLWDQTVNLFSYMFVLILELFVVCGVSC